MSSYVYKFLSVEFTTTGIIISSVRGNHGFSGETENISEAFLENEYS